MDNISHLHTTVPVNASGKTTVLIADDDEDFASQIVFALERAGFATIATPNGEEALGIARQRMPHLVLLDWMLPGLPGVEVCRLLRKDPATRAMLVIIMTARKERTHKTRGINVGADDYIERPFSPTDLIDRISILLGRVSAAEAPPVILCGDIVMDASARRVSRGGRNIHLGPMEWRLLKNFLCHPGRIFSREQLIDLVWGHDAVIEPRSVDVHVRRLRSALNRDGDADPIRTVRSAGYILDVESPR